MGFGGKKTSSGAYAPLYRPVFILACQATFLISINLFKFFSLLFFKYYCFKNDLIFSIFRNFHSIRDSIRWIELIYYKEAQNKGICLMYKDPTQPGEILPCRVNGSDVVLGAFFTTLRPQSVMGMFQRNSVRLIRSK